MSHISKWFAGFCPEQGHWEIKTLKKISCGGFSLVLLTVKAPVTGWTPGLLFTGLPGGSCIPASPPPGLHGRSLYAEGSQAGSSLLGPPFIAVSPERWAVQQAPW